jgi:hypothetical protein
VRNNTAGGFEIGSEEKSEPSVNRRSFLRKVGLTLAVGIGAIALPSVANATLFPFHCCFRTSCGPCPSGQEPYWCTSGSCPPNTWFCQCTAIDTTCFDEDLQSC